MKLTDKTNRTKRYEVFKSYFKNNTWALFLFGSFRVVYSLVTERAFPPGLDHYNVCFSATLFHNRTRPRFSLVQTNTSSFWQRTKEQLCGLCLLTVGGVWPQRAAQGGHRPGPRFKTNSFSTRSRARHFSSCLLRLTDVVFFKSCNNNSNRMCFLF